MGARDLEKRLERIERNQEMILAMLQGRELPGTMTDLECVRIASLGTTDEILVAISDHNHKAGHRRPQRSQA